MKMRFALLVFTALFATDALAAPVPPGAVVKAPDWTAGSEWHYSDGYAVKVNSISAKGAMFERLDAPGQWFMRQGFIKTDSTSGTATRNAIYRTIPDTAGLSLSAGKPLTFQREYLNNGKLLVHASSWTVEGRETITVPAGSFDCWVIVWRTRSMKSDWTGFERWWYSPQVQNYVRMEYKYGPAEDGSRVLMNYSLAGTQNVAAAAPVPPVSPQALPAPVPSAARASAQAATSLTVAAPVRETPTRQPDTSASFPDKESTVSPIAVPPKRDAARKIKSAVLVAPGIQPSVQVSDIAAAMPALPEHLSPILTEKPPPPDVAKLAKAEIAPDKETPVAEAFAAKSEARDDGSPEGASAQLAKGADAKPAKATRAGLPKGDKSGPWHAQLGTSRDGANVRTSLKKILARNPGARELPRGVTVREVKGRTFYRAWLGSYGSAPEARSLCKVLNLKKTRVSGCTVFKGATILQARAD